MLDIEVAGTVVPKATIAVYFAPNTNKGFLDAINAAIHDTERKPGVVSISWGSPESAAEAQSNQAYHELFVEAAALGVTVCAATGDHGSADMAGGDWDGGIHADHPAVDPYVLACGGTQIDGAGRDVAWNDGTPFDANSPDGGGWAGGGGVSTVFELPAYQKKAKIPKSLVSGKTGRGIPDIAMSATNYFTRTHGFDGASGGTSAVAPLMAALVARLNQAKGKNVGFLNPFLYANAAVVAGDVVSGSNAIVGAAKGYKARKGWDACTGLGTPIGEKILARL
jgi:kumamolisin